MLDRLANFFHLSLALAVLWLLASSPWIGMVTFVPDPPGLVTFLHVALGLATLPLALVYLLACTRGGRWRLSFPWLAGDLAAVSRDLDGLRCGERPMSEGGGLFGTIAGLLLLAVCAAAATGAGWYLAQETATALTWRAVHVGCAGVAGVLLVAHVVAVSLHLVDLLRD